MHPPRDQAKDEQDQRWVADVVHDSQPCPAPLRATTVERLVLATRPCVPTLL